MTRYFLAIDIGASSGRHVLGHVEDGRITLEEIFRFDNTQIRKGDHDCWNLESLWENILEGLAECKKLGKVPETMGIDTWGVDFVLLDENGQLIGDCVAYRDSRTSGMDKKVFERISAEDLYSKTGIQFNIINTIYQLMALSLEHPEQLQDAERFLMVPDYFNFLLTGCAVNEYTNATTTNMLNAKTKDWDRDVLAACGFPAHIFHKPEDPGIVLGSLLPEVQARIGFDAKVVLPATHDTGSAYLAVPAKDENAVYLSSGTWSLIGVEQREPITTEHSRLHNFSNEGGYEYRFRYLKNIMGLWMLQSIRRELNGINYVKGASSSKHVIKMEGDPDITFVDLINFAKRAREKDLFIDVNEDRFLEPKSMIDEILAACYESGRGDPQTYGEVVQCVYNSLSKCYADAVHALSQLTGREYTSVNIVGGGCQDDYLNQLTANECGIPVFAGPIEGTSLGNLIVQFIAAGEFASVEEARAAIHPSFDIKRIDPIE